MAISESQLETWANQGSITQSKNTYATIKSALDDANSSYYENSFDVFLQGSYGNDTNIYGESDVDVVIRLDSIFRSNITERPTEEQEAYNRIFSDATYSFDDFKAAVQAVLIKRFGTKLVKPGNKAITIAVDGSRRSSDVVVCYQYRTYRQFDPQKPNDCTLGIIFPSASGDIINYPKLHSSNLTELHQTTGSMFKPMVRILKNMRSRMVEEGRLRDGAAPSYYLEGLFFNVPAEQYVLPFPRNSGHTERLGYNTILKPKEV